MARLDRRLFPFLEMLVDLGLDWLAFEVVDGIRHGVEPWEPEDVLAEARARARVGEPVRLEERKRPDIPAEAKPLLGDEQLDWVVGYIERRLEETLAEAITALRNLDAVIDESSMIDARAPDLARNVTKLVLLGDEEASTLDLRQAEEAQLQLEKLKGALVGWLKSTRREAAK